LLSRLALPQGAGVACPNSTRGSFTATQRLDPSLLLIAINAFVADALKVRGMDTRKVPALATYPLML